MYAHPFRTWPLVHSEARSGHPLRVFSFLGSRSLPIPVIVGPVPTIHVLSCRALRPGRGCSAQGRAWRRGL